VSDRALLTFHIYGPHQGTPKGVKYHCTVDLLFDWFGINCLTTDNICFYLQNRPILTSQTGGQWYSDTSRLVFLAHTLKRLIPSASFLGKLIQRFGSRATMHVVLLVFAIRCILATFHFLLYLQMGPISWSVCPTQAFPCGVM
jgi:hypothetical protein